MHNLIDYSIKLIMKMYVLLGPYTFLYHVCLFNAPGIKFHFIKIISKGTPPTQIINKKNESSIIKTKYICCGANNYYQLL